jgi:hypothetical protein
MSQHVAEHQQEDVVHERVREALIQAGLVSPDPQPLIDAPPLSNEERQVLAERLGQGTPLSELILADRHT